VLERAAAQSLTFLNALALVFIIGPIVTPLVLAAGATGGAAALYRFFHLLCHQWAFRSFFVLGPQATFSRDELNALGVDPYTFMGDAQTGWKMAFCERNLAIFAGLLAFGLAYAAARRQLRAASFPEFVLLVAPADATRRLAGEYLGAADCYRASVWARERLVPVPEVCC